MDGIRDDDELYRRLTPESVNKDGTVNSSAWVPRKNEPGVSVNIVRLTTEEATMAPRPEFGLGKIRVADVKQIEGLDVVYHPIENENDAHAQITGIKTKSQRRQLANVTVLIRQPTRQVSYQFRLGSCSMASSKPP